MKNNNTKDFWVIGVGASAGGLEALSAFFKSLSQKPNAAFIVAQHLAPHAKSMMVELLARQTSLPVIAIKDHLQVKPGVISIVPPNYDVIAEDGELRLSMAGNETRPKPSIDAFFTSLAKVYGKRSVGIILSGTGSDGTEGIRAIKESGGVTIAQEISSAKYDGMPKSAIDTGLVDTILPAEQIAEQLSTILERGYSESVPQELNVDDQTDFAKILKYLKAEIGSDFTQYKISTIQRRIEKRIQSLKLRTLHEYFDYLKAHPGELPELSQSMLVSVTSFFRDTEAFQAVGKVLENMIFEKKTGEELRIWSAGCATGEEPYSLAFMINDIIEKTGKMVNVKIFATDLDLEALNSARTGYYTKDDVRDLPKELISKYFDRRDEFFEVKKYIKDMIVFAKQDLIQNPPFVRLDMVTCRNVLIYFESALQSRIFEIFHYALKPQGILFLGKSESTSTTLFDNIDRKEKIFRRVNVISKFSHSGGKYTVGSNRDVIINKRKTQSIGLLETGSLQILKQFGISGIVIDEDSAILHIIGNVSPFIAMPEGSADFRLSSLLNKNATIEFSVLLKKCQKENKLVKSRAYKSSTDAKKNFSFTISKLDHTEDLDRPLFLVTFEPRKTEEYSATTISHDSPSGKVLELERDLTAMRENLQTVIEELEISNEELQSLNEELSSTNEELQASNEELETTNEELQSSNEELMTVNEELNIKSGELKSAYTSLDNIQTSVGFPLIVIDSGLRVIRYNPSSNVLFTLSINDIGQPITRASCACEIPNFEQLIRKTLDTGVVSETFCEANGKVYQLRIHPSRDENRKTIGAILVFFDNTEFLRAQDKLKVSDKRIRAIIDSSPTLVTLKDTQVRYLMVNESFCKFFKVKEDEILGKTDREIMDSTVAISFRENDLEVLLRKTSFEKDDVLHLNGKTYFFRSNRFPLYAENDRTPYAVGSVMLDTTSLNEANLQLQASESRYRAMIEEQAVFVCRHSSNGDLTFVNTAFLRFYGGDKNTIRKFITLIDTKDQKKVTSEISKISVDHPIVQYETRVGGSPNRWVRWIHRGIFNEYQQITEYQAVGFDVTEIHNQTSELLAKENLYTHVLEYTSDYLSVYRFENGKFYLESFNQSAAYNRGFNSQRLVGRNLEDLVEEKQLLNVLSKYRKSIETNSVDTFEETIEGPGGVLYLSTTIVPIHDSAQDVTRVVALSRDITKLKRIEKALRDEKKNADSANLAKSDFLASMSHELRTPLNVIMGMSQLLLRGNIDPKHIRLVESIQRSSKVLLSLIEDVLDLSKIEAGKISFESKPFDLDQLTNDVIQSFETEASRKKISLHRVFRVKPNIPLLGDEVRIKQVIINLIGNAIKFTEKGGVELNVSLQSKGDKTSSIYFEVKDTGIGIPEESHHKIFHRFSQADSGTARKYGGTGLGLAISKQLVELMNGTIGFDSEDGRGTTFWFKIELPDAVQENDLNHYVSDNKLDYSKFKVLAVDDNPESLNVLRFYFEDHKGNIDFAESGPEAIQKVNSGQFDLVLMDMQMPGMDGLEATRQIRLGPKAKVPVIALTANAMSQDKEKCLAAGMDDFLTKPVDFDALNAIIKKWIKK